MRDGYPPSEKCGSPHPAVLHPFGRLDSDQVEAARVRPTRVGYLCADNTPYGALSRFQRFSTSRLVGGLSAPAPKLIVPAANTLAPDRR